ncbi:Uncharacterized protein pbN1_13340 [Aromatoleum bremense]|nr:Uncharacterized protein pbN1_13340 [Aromatoleum bremense]
MQVLSVVAGASGASAKDAKGKRNGVRKPKLVRDSFTFPEMDRKKSLRNVIRCAGIGQRKVRC